MTVDAAPRRRHARRPHRPVRRRAPRRELADDGDGYGTKLVLDTVFESYRVDEEDGGAWVDFTMPMQTKGAA